MKDYIDRRFLNKGSYHTLAAICAKCEIDEEELKRDTRWGINAELSISDCNRVIDLDMNTHTDKDFNNSLYKLRQIEKTVKFFREYLEELREEVNKLKKDEKNNN